MANLCQNVITFSGKNFEKGMVLFNDLIEEQQRRQMGVRPSFCFEGRYLFDISIEAEVIHCQTKWAPPLDVMREVGEYLDVDFEMEYQESGEPMFGRFWRENGEFGAIELEDEDFNLVSYKEDIDRYVFEGEEYECQEEVLEIILERKLNTTLAGECN